MVAIYELEPIGVDGKLEAVAEHAFCSVACASGRRAMWNDGLTYSDPKAAEPTMDGLVCEKLRQSC